jgi:pyruvate formate lyase activating enzyme
MQDALFYEKFDDSRLKCYLCPRYCLIKPGQIGFCGVRKNINGSLKTLVYGKPSAVNVDPIEKKPLYHFLPGTKIVSVGTAGCNMACKFCQNCDLSVSKFDESQAITLPPQRLTQLAVHYNSGAIAYTYNEPTIFAEYAMETARISQKHNIKNVMVTNGYITSEVIEKVYKNIDAANIDLKSFNSEFYKKLTLSRLEPVLDSIKQIKQLGKWIEITTLVIPGSNDNENEIARIAEWIISELGTDVPLHLSAFHPAHKMNNIPATTPTTLHHLRKVALQKGLHFVYLGNIGNSDASNTYCPECKSLLIKRTWYENQVLNFANGKCQSCGKSIPGVFN